MRQFNLRMFILLVFLALIGMGCGSYRTHHSKDFVRTEIEYRTREKMLSRVQFVHFEFDNRDVHFRIEEEYAIPEYRYDLYREGTRTSKDPDMISILNPMGYVISILTLDGDFVDNFGYPGKWRYTEVKQNAEKIGSKGERRYSSSYRMVDVSLNNSRWKKAQADCDGYNCRLNIGAIAEQLPVKPENLAVQLRVSKKNCIAKAKFTINAAQISAMQLHSDDWDLPVDERLRKYLVAMKEKIRAKAPEDALTYFEKVEMLGVSLPPSFDFQYGKTLVDAGYAKDGRERLDRYLALTGNAGKYYTEAQELIGSLENRIIVTIQ